MEGSLLVKTNQLWWPTILLIRSWRVQSQGKRKQNQKTRKAQTPYLKQFWQKIIYKYSNFFFFFLFMEWLTILPNHSTGFRFFDRMLVVSLGPDKYKKNRWEQKKPWKTHIYVENRNRNTHPWKFAWNDKVWKNDKVALDLIKSWFSTLIIW